MSERPDVVLAHHDNQALSNWRTELEGEGFRVQATASGADVMNRVESGAPDAVVLEPLLPAMNGLAVLKGLKSRPETAAVRVVMVLDEGDTYTENRALICGADGIVRRTADGSLPRGALAAKLRSLLEEGALEGAVADPEAESGDLGRLLETAARDLKAENPVLAHITDPLTGLFNRDYLHVKLSEEFKRSRRFGIPLSVVLIQLRRGGARVERDMDPDWRHVLNEVAGLLLCESRDIDVLARADTDSFCLVLPHTPAPGAQAMVHRILTNIERRGLGRDDDGEAVAAAAGLAEYTGEGADAAEDLERRAQAALRQAWREGAGHLVTWTKETG